MKILVIYRTEKDAIAKSVKEIAENLKKMGNGVEIVSRNEDLNLQTLSSSMDSLRAFVTKMDEKENYDIIYSQDWSIAFPLLIPNRILTEKHYCLFHNIEPSGAQSKILQRIVGNMIGEKLIVKTKELKEKFPKAVLSHNGIDIPNLDK